MWVVWCVFCFFFFNDTATTEIYTLSLHDALPICGAGCVRARRSCWMRRWAPSSSAAASPRSEEHTSELRHVKISYAVFCLKKKKKTQAGGSSKRKTKKKKYETK